MSNILRLNRQEFPLTNGSRLNDELVLRCGTLERLNGFVVTETN